MPYSANQQVSLGFGIFVTLISGFFVVKKILRKKQISSVESLFQQSLKNNLNKISQKGNMDIKYLIGFPIALENVNAHFSKGSSSEISFLQNQYENFIRIKCDSFHAVQKNQNNKPFQLFRINALDTLVSQKIIIPNNTFKSSLNMSNKILTSATTLGIIGTLRLSTDYSSYDIEAKIIGVDLQEIKKYIQEENFFNNLSIILSGAGVILGIWWFIRSTKKQKRVSFEASLLQTGRKKIN